MKSPLPACMLVSLSRKAPLQALDNETYCLVTSLGKNRFRDIAAWFLRIQRMGNVVRWNAMCAASDFACGNENDTAALRNNVHGTRSDAHRICANATYAPTPRTIRRTHHAATVRSYVAHSTLQSLFYCSIVLFGSLSALAC